MTSTLLPSPALKATDLMRVNIDLLTLVELDNHAINVLYTISELNDYINSPTRKSFDLLRDAIRLAKKLSIHMLHVRDLVHAQSAATALMHASNSRESKYAIININSTAL